jgi:hypothetical protein
VDDEALFGLLVDAVAGEDVTHDYDNRLDWGKHVRMVRAVLVILKERGHA